MTEKKEKSLRQRFLSAQKKDHKRTASKPTFPQTFGGVAGLFPEAHKSLLDYARKVKEVYLERHVVMMEYVSTSPSENWRNRWRGDPSSSPVIEHTLSAPETAMLYHLQQLEGYKKLHEICRQKDVDAQVSLKQVERTFITTQKYWAIVIDLTKPYRSSPDAALFNELFKKEKKAAKAAKPSA
ncbi:MAG: hypothetical protein K8R48_00900 [Alphaproteobacteria bacterium]|nr:hypothetical protein [Alphaproteobacteria bacterium]